jgi:hypothetical protein
MPGFFLNNELAGVAEHVIDSNPPNGDGPPPPRRTRLAAPRTGPTLR